MATELQGLGGSKVDLTPLALEEAPASDDPTSCVPVEIFLHIFSFLPDVEDLYNCSWVNRRWREYSKEEELWERLIKVDTRFRYAYRNGLYSAAARAVTYSESDLPCFEEAVRILRRRQQFGLQ